MRLPSRFAARLKQAAVLTLQRYDVAAGTELGVVLTDEKQLRRLNRDFRGIDEATDVLSFGMNVELPTGHVYLGDVIIAVPVARVQARAAGHDELSELSLLVVHGVLHLLGHDHAGAEERAAMWEAQEEILSRLDLKARPTEA